MKITLTGNKSGIYIDPRNNNAFVDYKAAENFSEVNLCGVNHLAIHREENGAMRIFQASGYNSDRGMFTDMY